MSDVFENLLHDVRACALCADFLPNVPRPILQCDSTAKILIVGQAPGKRAHEMGIPFNDPSGDRLRMWMGVGKDIFYDASKIAIIPMGFCYPGTGQSGDYPPRPECAPTWHPKILDHLSEIQLTLVIGQYAHARYIASGKNLTETVRSFKNYWPKILPLPHPSPRNNIFLKKIPWFEQEIVPLLKNRVKDILK